MVPCAHPRHQKARAQGALESTLEHAEVVLDNVEAHKLIPPKEDLALLQARSDTASKHKGHEHKLAAHA